MRPKKSTDKERDWYKVSVETLQGWAVFFLLVILSVGGYFGYQRWESLALQREAAEEIDRARVLLQEVGSRPDLEEIRDEYQAAFQTVEEARSRYQAEEYREALGRATAARQMLASLEAAGDRRRDGEAQFIAVQGRVEFRRGERGEWETARSRIVLEPGDYVKTGPGGSAEVMFADGTLYLVRPSTLFVVSRSRAAEGGDRSIELQYGWINLNTAQRSSTVATPKAEARIETETEAVVSFDEGDQSGEFTAYRGAMEVSSGGQSKRVEALQTVAQRGDEISDPKSLPPAPALLAPPENADINIDETEELVLDWGDVEGGERYALQVSPNRLFVDNLIDVASRRKTAATLGLQGEGSFVWRVAAITDEGLKGPWSPAGRFRVASFRGSGSAGDDEPPELAIEDVQSYGSIFIISGQTEPGASMWINGESVTVEADGSFTKTIQIIQEGWAFIEVRAVDAWGNETKQRNRVFAEGL